MRHVVGSILISKYRSWCTLTFLKCVKKGKLCQNATLKERIVYEMRRSCSEPGMQVALVQYPDVAGMLYLV